MPLGRFATYFCALAAVCLIAFPRAVGSTPGGEVLPGVAADAGAESAGPVPAPAWRPDRVSRRTVGAADLAFDLASGRLVRATDGIQYHAPLRRSRRPVVA